MTLRIYNTLNRSLEPITKEAGPLLLYACGPTVYHYAHIGNFRTFVFEDLLRRTLKYLGFPIKQVMNLTDVDDKTIKGANDRGISLREFTDYYIKAFLNDLKTLRCEEVEHYPRATDHIPTIVSMIQTMIEKKAAYQGEDGSIYFKVSAFPHYGSLSKLERSSLKSGASQRIRGDEYSKEDASDFALWKAYDPDFDQAVFWETTLGKGRPGWHIECSAMAKDLLGDAIDIHCGGIDLCFPHHENEIAQTETCTHKTFSRFWIHAEHLLVDDKKMSKSLGNFYTLRDLLEKGYSGRDLRMFYIQSHYRMQQNFTFEGLEASKHALDRIDHFIDRLEGTKGVGDIDPLIEETKKRFEEAILEDLNFPIAFSHLFNFIRETNRTIDKMELSQEGANRALVFLRKIDQVLGIFAREKEVIPEAVLELSEKRLEARKNRLFEEADRLREEIRNFGYDIEDSPTGPKIVKKS